MPSSTVHFTSLGSVGEVGASAHLINIDGLSLLLDCGLHPKGEGKASLPDFSHLREAPDAVIVSHAHHDHCAALPYLLKMFPAVVPYATASTARILERMLHNSVSVMEKIRLERGVEDYPLYDHNDVDFAMRKIYPIQFDHAFGILPDNPVRVTFKRAGHVLGSASVYIEGSDHTVLYTSDVCTRDQELLARSTLTDKPDSVDTLIIESTYGANEEASTYHYPEEIEKLAEGINRVIGRGGVVLIPAFALGRSQEMLNVLARLQETHRIPDVPIFASGLGRAVYEIYYANQEEFREGVEMVPLSEFGSVGDIWDAENIRNVLKEPCIIVATSGMLVENTPSAMIAQHLVRDERHGIFFVGYCDPDTLGHKLREAKKGAALSFILGRPPVPVMLEDIQSYHFSAHADRDDLVEVIQAIASKNIIFVHGDPPAVEWMNNHTGDGRRKFTPRVGEPVTLEA